MAVVNTVWPRTIEAAWPFVNGVLYLRTRLLKKSATHRLPDASTATEIGAFSEVAVGGVAATEPDVKLACPSTIDAGLPFVNGASNLKTRLAAVSATQMFPEASEVTAAGLPAPGAETEL